jgi:glucose-1-phosphate cytidylyltransferase
MKTVILCGGLGTRLGAEGRAVPKGLIHVGTEPILSHLMRCYAAFGLQEFVLCVGYRGEDIAAHFHQHPLPGTTVQCMDTGLATNTGGRLHRIRALLADDDSFCVTYGDGLADVNLHTLIAFHRSHGKVATLTAVHPVSPFGEVTLGADGDVRAFQEKPQLATWVNGGFFVFTRRVFDYLSDESVLERAPFEALARAGELMAFRHDGFWKCMDTFKDHHELNELWNTGRAPWTR